MFDVEMVRRALARVYADTEVSELCTRNAPWPDQWFRITPADGSAFEVCIASDGSRLGVDGVPEQTALVAAAVRAEAPSTVPRVVAIDPRMDGFVDLIPGMTAEEVATGWRPLAAFAI